MQTDPRSLLKEFVAEVGKLIDARAQTTETNLKSHVSSQINASEQKLQKQILSVRTDLTVTKVALQADIGELRTDVKGLKADLKETKGELQGAIQETKDEIKVTKMELKADIHNLRTGVARKLTEHEERIEKTERALRTPSKH